MNRFANIRRLLCLLLCLGLAFASVGTAAAAQTREYIYVRPLAGGISQVAMSEDHVAVLRSDGTVAAVGNNDRGQCDVSQWSRVVKIWACRGATVGLTQEGQVLHTCKMTLFNWDNIVDVALYRSQDPDIVVLLGLKADGTCVRAGASKSGPFTFSLGACDVSSWKDVQQIAAEDGLYGLTADGTVLEAQPRKNMLRTNPAAHWKDIKELVSTGAGLFGITQTGGVFTSKPGAASERWEDTLRVIPGGDGALYGLSREGAIYSGENAAISILGRAGFQDVAGSSSRVVALNEDGTLFFWPELEGKSKNQQNPWQNVEELVYSPGSAEFAVLRYDGTVSAALLDAPSKKGACDGWTNIARLYCYKDRWLGLQEDGGLIASFEDCDLTVLSANIKDTRPQEQPRGLMAAGIYHSVYVRSDGRVSGAGLPQDNRLAVTGWTQITAVSAYDHTVGIRADGSVVATGNNIHGQCNVAGWEDIVDISAGGMNTIGLTSKGTVVVTGSDLYGQHNLAGRRNVVMVEAGGTTVYALTDQGTVVAAGSDGYGQARVKEWMGVVAISAGTSHVVALLSDGTVVAAGSNEHGQCDVSQWRDIVAISAGGTHTVGLKANGSLVFAGSNEFGQGDLAGWKNVIAIDTGLYHTLGLTSTGGILSTGSNVYGQCNVAH